MFQDNDIENIKKDTGIQNGKDVTSQQFETIMDKIALGEISKEQAMLLLNTLPNFIQLQKIYIDGIKIIADSAKETQKSTIEAISKATEIDTLIAIIDKLLDTAESEELKTKILDYIVEITKLKLEIERDKVKTLKEVNESNNSFWKKIALTAAAVVGVAVTAVGVVAMSKKDSEEKA